LKIAFKEAGKKYRTPEDIAQHREDAVKEFLKEFFPPTYQLGKGEIIDSLGKRSNQVDVIICNQYHPFTLSSSGRGLFFAEGVVCAIEIKSDLSDKREIDRVVLQVQSVKKLERKHQGGDEMFGSIYDQDRIKRIPCIVFTYQSPSLSTLKSNLMKSHTELQIPIEETLDGIVSLEEGMVYNVKDPRNSLVITKAGERQLGLVGIEHKDKTLLEFLLYLSHVVPTETRIIPIVRLYFQKIAGEHVNVV